MVVLVMRLGDVKYGRTYKDDGSLAGEISGDVVGLLSILGQHDTVERPLSIAIHSRGLFINRRGNTTVGLLLVSRHGV